MQRGLDDEEAMALIVNGFCKAERARNRRRTVRARRTSGSTAPQSRASEDVRASVRRPRWSDMGRYTFDGSPWSASDCGLQLHIRRDRSTKMARRAGQAARQEPRKRRHRSHAHRRRRHPRRTWMACDAAHHAAECDAPADGKRPSAHTAANPNRVDSRRPNRDSTVVGPCGRNQQPPRRNRRQAILNGLTRA